MNALLLTKNSVRNVCAEIAQDNLQDDVKKTMELFQKLSKSDPDFKFSVQLDEENKIKSLMWCSGRSRRMYSHFGDAVTFDTTHQTNFYDMTFGICWCFADNEDKESFEWAFSEFINLMGGPPPMTILTDQAPAMAAAIRKVYPHPQTVHRWCKWHVLKDTQTGIDQVYVNDKEFKNEFQKIVNEMMTIEEFNEGWNITNFEIQSLEESFPESCL
ncbi:hypothetical protein OsJ_28640 [Oryza sativa Japonica Group]|uniref:Far-red impaired response protein-like n=1 Tax=Oryza sativa subsp. japonica TaxID=39947 RepID=A3BWS7_ORYSJ|nr:hypothetical protein OsJ_28640 [Oryza sativa Japonica Group]BAD46499.1 far-red impaired response protein-like [Oryza sativa Japonica Group]BAD46502.1 far-red impaired response protein-like [Oryza sativa Japonica Group]